MESGLGRGHPQHAAEGAERYPYTIGETGPSVGEFPDVQPRIGEAVGQEPEPRDQRRPPVAARFDVEDVHLQDVTGPGPLDEHRAAYRVDPLEVQGRHRRRVAPRRQLAPRRVLGLDVQLAPRRHPQQRGWSRLQP